MLIQCKEPLELFQLAACTHMAIDSALAALHTFNTYHATLAKLKLASLQALTDKSSVTVVICSLSAVNTASGSTALAICTKVRLY